MTYFGCYDVELEKVTKRPQYSTDKISKHDAIKAEEMRETNLSESFHSQLVQSVGENPNFWKVIKGLQTEEANAKVNAIIDKISCFFFMLVIQVKWLADTYQVIPQHMRSTRNQQYKSEKKRLHRMINTYDKNKVQDFISGATKLYHQCHLID